MNILQIKDKLAISALQLVTARDINDVPTSWMRHWDNDRRIAVSIHKDLVGELKADKEISSLGLQKEVREGEQGEYTSYRIVRYTPAEEVL